jgi:mono/diheme cytochrome c family protein
MPLKSVIACVLLVTFVACARQESPATETVAPAPTTATTASEPAPVTETVEPPADPALIASGDEIFKANCSRCHIGEKKSLRTPAVQSLSNADLEKTIRGANQMVTARGMHKVVELSDNEMKAVVAYIKSLE